VDRKVLRWFGHVKRIELLITKNVRVGMEGRSQALHELAGRTQKALVRGTGADGCKYKVQCRVR